ncbi:hypothetical protein KY332_03335 [Candidatus Woesearchaeota archaeon]|nr:hypothetical protein [Candidatus Woesearchaeota archaeon]
MKKILTYSPGRAAVIGNPSDIYGGATIALTFKDFGSYVAIEPSEHLEIQSKIVRPTDQTLEEKTSLEMAIIFALRMKFPYKMSINPKVKITDVSDLPYESGLARSTGGGDGMIDGFNEYFDLGITDRREIAEILWDAEWFLGICGGQERYAIALDDHKVSRSTILKKLKTTKKKATKVTHIKPSRLYFMDFQHRGDHNSRGPYATVEEIHLPQNLPLAVVYTDKKTKKSTSFDYHKALFQVYENNPHKIKRAMNEIANLARESKEILNNGVDLEDLGELMTKSLNLRKKIFKEYTGTSGTDHIKPMVDILNQPGIREHVFGYNMPGSKSLSFLYEDNTPLKELEKQGFHVIKIN